MTLQVEVIGLPPQRTLAESAEYTTAQQFADFVNGRTVWVAAADGSIIHSQNIVSVREVA